MNNIFQITIEEIENIQKFYVFYHSSLVTFNPGLNRVLENIPNSKIIISNITNLPDKSHQRIDIEISDLKIYALNDGQNLAFRSCIIYLYSILENVILYKKFNKNTDECIYTINKSILDELFTKEENKNFIYKLRELRNSFVHDNSIGSKKRANRLSKAINNIEDENFNLMLKNIEIKVNEKIKFLNTDEFKWVIDNVIKICKDLNG